jgi:hypothetical protein
MIDKLFFVILVLNATGLFSFMAPQFGVGIGHVSLALLMLHGVYLVAKRRYLVSVFRRTDMGYWLFLLVLWPLFTVLYAPSLEIRIIALQVYYFSLLCGAVVYTMANGLPAIHRVMAVSLAVTIFGLVLSMLAPEHFQQVALLQGESDEDVFMMGRAFGFFMQPNQLALGLAYLFIGWFSLWRYKTSVLGVVAIVVYMCVVLLTGSRIGMVIAVIITTFTLAYFWRKESSKAVACRRLYAKALVLGVCVVTGIACVRYYAGLTGYEKGSLLDRMSTLVSFKLSDHGVRYDESVEQRLRAQTIYWSLIGAKLVWGHGLGSETYYYAKGPIDVTSHSSALQCTMAYGVLYPFAFSLLMVRLYRNGNRIDAGEAFGINAILQFVLVVLLVFTVSGQLLDDRAFYVVLGAFCAAVSCPGCVSSYSNGTDRIGGWLTEKRRYRGPLFGGVPK